MVAIERMGWTLGSRTDRHGNTIFCAFDAYERRVVHGTQASSEHECLVKTEQVAREAYARACDRVADHAAPLRYGK